MSRVQLEPKDPKHEIVVGLDRMLNTFFIIVTIKQADDDLEDLDPLEFKAKWSRNEILGRLEKYAVDSPRTKAVARAIFLDVDPAETVPEKIPDGE